jgi:divalent metal cation (Fe/Co/Zn/Cd) transporter
MGEVESAAHLLRRGQLLEAVTLSWNVVGIVVLAIAAIDARSVALAGFGLDSLIEIGASTVVLWELSGSGEDRQRRALRLIGSAFIALAVYLAIQSSLVLAIGYHPRHSVLGIAWTAVTAVAMFLLAAGKARTGRALQNRVLQTEGRVTAIDGVLAVAVLAGLVLNSALGWWWADPAAAYVLVYYASRESFEIFRSHTTETG